MRVRLPATLVRLSAEVIVSAIAAALPASGLASAGQASPPDPARGRALYHAVIVPNSPTCANGACHGPTPTFRQNRIHLGTTAADIENAIKRVYSMAFLDGRLSRRAMSDLAAYIADAEQEDERPQVRVAPRVVDFGVQPPSLSTGTAPAARQALTVRNVGARPVTIASVQLAGSAFLAAGGECRAGLRLDSGRACKIVLSHRADTANRHEGELRLGFLDGLPVVVTPLRVAIDPNHRGGSRMAEFTHHALDYYFQTARSDEQTLLDSLEAFERTGSQHPVTANPGDGRVPLTRFYFDRVALFGQRGSHFYTSRDDERQLLRSLNPENRSLPRLPVDEGVDGWVIEAEGTGDQRRCPAGLRPVYRAFRGPAYPDDANHRFTTDPIVYATLLADGWDGEGIAYCVTPE